MNDRKVVLLSGKEWKVESGSKKIRHIQKLTIYKKIHIFFPILMKLGERNHLMR